ncbi:MAG: MATE family efflux transporter, partial [Butyrivibrio sp.]|nr:MATE family efflux transporter [Butyrivibrio sp.]
MSKTSTMDMTQGSIRREMILFAIPLLAGNIFQQLYNTIDSIIVGQYVGADALGAVTSVAPAINTLVGFFMGFSAGSSVVISHYFGAKNVDGLRSAVHTCISCTFILGLLLMFFGYYVTPPLLIFMSTPKSVMPLASQYLQIYFLGILGLMLYNIGSAILRAVGDSVRPLLFLVITSILNIILDLFFVVSLKMGVAGAAYATIISQFISAILTILVLFFSKEIYNLRIKELTIDRKILGQIIQIGMPAGIQSAVISFSNLFVQGYINRFGASSTAGWGAYGRIDAFVMLPMQSIALTATTFVGQNAGAGNVKRIKDGIRESLVLAAVCTVALVIPEFIAAPKIVSLFNADPEVIRYGTLFIRMNCFFDILCCSNQTHAGALRGVGDAKAPMYIMLFSFVLFRQIYLFIASHLTSSI